MTKKAAMKIYERTNQILALTRTGGTNYQEEHDINYLLYEINEIVKSQIRK